VIPRGIVAFSRKRSGLRKTKTYGEYSVTDECENDITQKLLLQLDVLEAFVAELTPTERQALVDRGLIDQVLRLVLATEELRDSLKPH